MKNYYTLRPTSDKGNKCLKRAWSMHWNHDAKGQILEFLFASPT